MATPVLEVPSLSLVVGLPVEVAVPSLVEAVVVVSAPVDDALVALPLPPSVSPPPLVVNPLALPLVPLVLPPVVESLSLPLAPVVESSPEHAAAQIREKPNTHSNIERSPM